MLRILPPFAGLLLVAFLLPGPGTARAQTATNPPTSTTATRPEKTPASQTSLPDQAPPAGTTQRTGTTNQPPVVKEMNNDAKAKIEKEGK